MNVLYSQIIIDYFNQVKFLFVYKIMQKEKLVTVLNRALDIAMRSYLPTKIIFRFSKSLNLQTKNLLHFCSASDLRNNNHMTILSHFVRKQCLEHEIRQRRRCVLYLSWLLERMFNILCYYCCCCTLVVLAAGV